MNENNVVVDIPKHFVMLDVISVRLDDVSKLSKAANVDRVEVETNIDDHATQRLIVAEQKMSLFDKTSRTRTTESENKLS